MGRTSLHEAIILRAIDIGEADRLCILLTREGGRLAARAKSVRKPGSRLGGVLLPFKHISVELRESDAGNMISSAQDKADARLPANVQGFVQLQQAAELILALTEEAHPLPEVFDLLLTCIRHSPEFSGDPLPAFRLRLFHILGFLPATNEDLRFDRLPLETKAYIESCTQTDDLHLLTKQSVGHPALETFIRSIMESQIDRPLKSDRVATDIAR